MKQLIRIILPMTGRVGIIKYVLLGLSSGLCSFLFINSVIRVVGMITAGKYTIVRKEYLIIFAAIILVFIWIKRTLALLMMNVSQKISWHLRKDILSLVLSSNYMQLAVRKDRIMASVVNDVGTLTGASMSIIDFSISVIMVVSCFIYMASISVMLFFVTIFVTVLGTVLFWITQKRNMLGLEKVRALENSFQENFNAILGGYKEIYMEPQKGKYLFDRKVSVIANESYRTNITTMTAILNNGMTGQIMFYILISSILLVFSVTLGIKPAETVSFVFTLIYLLGSMEAIMTFVPMLMRARVASANLGLLKMELEEIHFDNRISETKVYRNTFNEMTIRGLEFSYGKEQSSFGVGPVDLDFQKGEVVFIYGGNGSGKTTLVYSILGLCFPDAGEIRLNGILVTAANYSEYRSLFAVVFNDFYLFREVLADDPPDRVRWNDYLHLFELEGKVTLEGNRLSTTDLSAGQRKRLALMIALMEDKPILVLDEWAQDQDPYFRKKFYTEILPLLKRAGYSVLAITHDDKYYRCADRLYKMDEGKLFIEHVDAEAAIWA